MAGYGDYFTMLLEQARINADEYAAEQKKKAGENAKAVRDEYGKAIQLAERQSRQALAQTETEYRQAYDANAVSEAVARRNAAEAMANSGLTNSGMNATQQTAISLARSRADGNVTLQKQEAVNRIMRELDAARLQYQKQTAEEVTAIYEKADDDIRATEAAEIDRASKLAQGWTDADQKAAKHAAEMSILEIKAKQEAKKLLGDGEDTEPQDEMGVLPKEIEAVAAKIRQKKGNLEAWKYLRTNEALGNISADERLTIMLRNNIRETQTVNDAYITYVDRMINKMIKNGDYKDAKVFAQTLIKNGLLDMTKFPDIIGKVY